MTRSSFTGERAERGHSGGQERQGSSGNAQLDKSKGGQGGKGKAKKGGKGKEKDEKLAGRFEGERRYCQKKGHKKTFVLNYTGPLAVDAMYSVDGHRAQIDRQGEDLRAPKCLFQPSFTGK